MTTARAITIRPITIRKPLTLALIVLAFTAASAAQATFKVIHTFTGKPDGISPWGALINDNHGNVYGTTTAGGGYGYGSVYELTPPTDSGGKWTENVIHSFQGSSSDRETPVAALVIDSAGNLYGTTVSGGIENSGTVFEMSPPTSGGPWTETTLYKFNPETGTSPGGLLRGRTGILYGTTVWGDNVYEVKPVSGGTAAEKNLFTFNGGSNGLEPMYEGGALISDAAGNLYGVTAFGGTYGEGNVFELSPPTAVGGAWTEAVLYSFGAYPQDGSVSTGALVLDADGNLYGTTVAGGILGEGIVFELSPPASEGLPWTETRIHSFSGGASDGAAPYAGLVMDKSGNLYGVTYSGGPGDCEFNYPGCGTVFELSASGSGTWTERVLHSLNGSTDGEFPYAGLMIDDSNHLFGATSGGGAKGNGTVFEVVP
jgi:uncharacterized repeat protein (TIGR03803 family)